jgi:hypothetical protein
MGTATKHRKENATHRKCADIVRFLVNHCNAHPEGKGSGQPVIGFGPDWGDNTLTIYRKAAEAELLCGHVLYDHTHAGSSDDEGGAFDDLVDELYDLLINGRGLSWE